MSEAVRIWRNQYDILARIRSKRERNALAFAMISYAFTGESPQDSDLNSQNLIIFDAIKHNLIAKNQGGAPKGNNNRCSRVEKEEDKDEVENEINQNQPLSDNRYQITDNIHTSDKSSVCISRTQKFKKPTVEEIEAYCLERKNGIDPEKWFDFYQSKGWRVGSQPMKNWKAAVRTWERRDSYQTLPKKQNDDDDFYRKLEAL